MTLAEAIKKHRQDAKLSQEQLGKLLGVGRSTVARYESGQITPPYEAIYKMQDIFRDEFLNDAMGVDNLFAYEKTFNYQLISGLSDIYIPDYYVDDDSNYKIDLIVSMNHAKYCIDSKEVKAFCDRCREHLYIEFTHLLREKGEYQGDFDGEL